MAVSKQHYFFYTLCLVAAALCLAIFWPFLITIIFSASLAAVLYPAFLFVKKYSPGHKNWVAALAVTVLTFLILGAFVYFIGSTIIRELRTLYATVTDSGGSVFIDAVMRPIHRYLPGVTFDLRAQLASLASYLSGQAGAVFNATLSTVFKVLITLLALFYFLKDGDTWKENLVAVSPLPLQQNQKIVATLHRTIVGVFRGSLIVATAQGTLMGLGLWLFGVPNPALWGVLAGCASLVPSVGTSLVAVPAIIYVFVTGTTLQAVCLTIWCLTLVGGIDNVLNQIIVGKTINLPPLVVLFAVLGGIALMGPLGILIGPLAVSLFNVLMQIYRSEFNAG